MHSPQPTNIIHGVPLQGHAKRLLKQGQVATDPAEAWEGIEKFYKNLLVSCKMIIP
jgi:hypothetical protein